MRRGHMLQVPEKGGAPKGAVIFLATRNIQKYSVSSVDRWMGMKGQIMRIKMHMSDVISSISRSSKCTQIVDGWGFAPDPTDDLTVLPRPPSLV